MRFLWIEDLARPRDSFQKVLTEELFERSWDSLGPLE